MRAILEAALDCVVTMDENGCVVEFNPAAERTFGYAREDIVGREMAELIVPATAARDAPARPPALPRHRQRGGAEQADRDHRRCAPTAREFPVELAITRIPVPGAADVHRLPARHHRAQARPSRSCARRGRGSSRRPTTSAAGSSATSTTAPSSGSWRCRSLRLVQHAASSSDAADGAELLDEAIDELAGATAELRELARGIHPAVLTDRGLDSALKAVAGTRARAGRGDEQR